MDTKHYTNFTSTVTRLTEERERERESIHIHIIEARAMPCTSRRRVVPSTATTIHCRWSNSQRKIELKK